jgi:hypothetical protein
MVLRLNKRIVDIYRTENSFPTGLVRIQHQYQAIFGLDETIPGSQTLLFAKKESSPHRGRQIACFALEALITYRIVAHLILYEPYVIVSDCTRRLRRWSPLGNIFDRRPWPGGV